MSGVLYKEEIYSYQTNNLEIDTLKFVKAWKSGGVLYMEDSYKNGKTHGTTIVYWDNGVIKRRDKYIEGKFVKGNCFNEKGKKVKYYKFEKMPEYKGGTDELYEYLRSNIKYPKDAREAAIQGTVLVRFVVEKDGNISNVTVDVSVHKLLDEEAVRVISGMPKWDPGMVNQEPIRCFFVIPVVFNLK